MTRSSLLFCLILTTLAVPGRAQDAALQIAQSGPTGELASLEEANEVRVVFSEPMVVLGRIPAEVQAPFFHVTPAVPGSFRWSGTRTLIFTPAHVDKLPYATRYEVTIDAVATSATAKALGKPHTFSFTTPTLKLLETSWYRRKGRYDQPAVILLRFNQPVSAKTVLPHLGLALQPHEWKAPALPPDALARLAATDPAAMTDFDAKVARTSEAAASGAAVAVHPAIDWDKKTWPASDDLLVLETTTVPPTDGWIRIVLDKTAVGLSGKAVPGKEQDYTLKLEPTFFVEGLRCPAACDPEGYNPLRFRGRVNAQTARRAVRVAEVADTGDKPLPRKPKPKKTEEDEGQGEDEEVNAYDQTSDLTLEDAGFVLGPARNYAITVDRSLAATDGQLLGYSWAGLVENWHQNAFTSFGSGHGVWEKSGGPQLPFSARNLVAVKEWLAPMTLDGLMPAIKSLREKNFSLSPPGAGTLRSLSPAADTIQAFGLNLKPILGPGATSLGWAALEESRTLPRTHRAEEKKVRATLVQVTDLGISVKDSPSNTLVLVTRLSDGQPVSGAKVTIRTLANTVAWSGLTGEDGLAMAPETPALRDPENEWELRFIVSAEKDGDTAYVGSDWGEGIEPWAFGIGLDLGEAHPLLRGTVFSDRGVYKLGEEVHVKTILRSDTAKGIVALPAGTAVEVVLKDSQGEERDKRSVALSDWSSADFALTLPAEAPLGRYELTATVAGQKQNVSGGFLVAAYRRPDFRVDVNLAGESSLAGATLKGVVAGRYLFGAPMAARPVKWSYTKKPRLDAPRVITDKFPEERYVLVDEEREDRFEYHAEVAVAGKQATLDAQGQLTLDLETDLAAGRPFEYTLEGEVTDLSRQTIAGRASFRVDPAPWYVAVRRPGYFVDAVKGFDTDVSAVDLSGKPSAGVKVTVTLTRVQWHAVRRAEGQGYYTWESERREAEAGSWDVTTTDAPASLHVPVEDGGFFILRATAKDEEGRTATSATSFYALGSGYTSWQRYDHNRIDLVPEKKTYRAGETARIMIQSPWEKATALLTTEREGIRTQRVFQLSSTQETVSVPVSEEDIPNLFVSVMLVKGRTAQFTPEDSGDPGKPAYRVGYVELKVEDAAKRLQVEVKSDREEYRPAGKATVSVAVQDVQGRPAPAEVTLWAVDYGVLSITGYKTPDVLGSVWVEKALQVLTEDSRQNIISRRVLVSKGADEGGGGGDDSGPGNQVRKDFRVLAFWLGSLPTDTQGRATTTVTLPESLTTYRIMAVAGDRQSRFGFSEREIRTSKPVLLRPAFPRFLSLGDTASFGAVVNSQLKEKGTAIVTLKSLDPGVLQVAGEAKKTVQIGPKGQAEVRFDLRAQSVGRARLQMTVKLLNETDAFLEVLPVEVLATPETVAAYGEANPEAKESLAVPPGVIPGFGGLHVETASTALVGLGEGARYLVDYPYGCAEQRASATLALVLTADLGDAFSLPGIEPAKLKETAGATVKELEGFQCSEGLFAFWKGDCQTTSPYVTSWVLHVLQRAKSLGYAVPEPVLVKGYDALEKALGAARPENESWWPAYTAWQAFAVKVLAEGGRRQDSHVTRLYGFADRMPVFALAYLLDAMGAAGETGERPSELKRRIGNAVLPEGGTAHVEELEDPYLFWLWSSNVRSTSLVLGSLVRHTEDRTLVPGMVRWLMQARKGGRWGNTQENAAALEALVDYYKKYETAPRLGVDGWGKPPDFRAVIALGEKTLAAPEFHGRTNTAAKTDVPMKQLLDTRGAGTAPLPLLFKREGTGTLFYMARLRYASNALSLEGADRGFSVERSYSPAKAEVGTAPLTTFAAGDLVKVNLKFQLTKERRFVAVTDPLPAGFEPVETWFATTARDVARSQQREETDRGWEWWLRGGFDHVERHDDRVQLFATRLSEGVHEFSYVVRATTSGTFRTASTHVEEMYEPEVFGRSPSAVVTVKP